MTRSPVPLRALALIVVVSLLVPYGVIAFEDFDDLEDAALPWMLIHSNLAVGIAVVHSWLVARLDRRLEGPSASRRWALLEGPGVALGAVCLPVVLHGVALAMAGIVAGRWRWVERSLLSIPFVMGLALAVALLWGARTMRRARRPLPHDPGTLGDVVPTAWLWTAWVLATTSLLSMGVAGLASDVPLATGLALLTAWGVVAVAASLGVSRRVATALDPERIPHLPALAREAAGATAVGLLLPMFVVGLLPAWHSAEDTRWALLLGLLIAVPLAVWTQASGRVTRWARWV